MEHCKREEAIIAMKMALEKMEKKDFMGARKYANIAHKLFPDLENIGQMILVCDVHCYADEKVCGNEMDWYKILQIEKTDDEATFKRQYHRLALRLHPDKNRFPGAADAFQLIREAKTVLLDSEKRRWYDSICQAEVLWDYGCSRVRKKDESSRDGFEGSKRGKRRRGTEVSTKDCRKKRVSKKGNVVEDDADGMDDGVGIDCGVGKSKCRRSVDGSAQEVDKQGKRRVKFASQAQENGKRVEDDDMDDEVEFLGRVKKSRCSRSFDVSAQEVDQQGKRASSLSASKAQENGICCGDKSLPNRKNDANSARTYQFPAYTPSGIALDAKILEYSTAEFNDFDKEREKRCFGAGQIWATYDTLDAMPRFYCLINKVMLQDFKLQITWLEPYPHNTNERKWLYQGLPTSCGKFKLGYTEIIEDHAIFSHLINWRKGVNLPNIYEVHPRKGETWALFKNWDFECYQNPDSHRVYEFEFVEILSDYSSDVGVFIAFLRKIKGFTSLFCRVKEEEVDFEVIKDRFRLSHRVPSVEMKRNEGLNGIKRFFELDPASLPDDLSSH